MNEQIAGRCATCRWAEHNDEWDWLREPDGSWSLSPRDKRVDLARRFPLVCLRTAMYNGEPKSEETLTFAMDGEDYKATLFVSKNFGCVMWEPKP